jgi:hypothetical protein
MALISCAKLYSNHGSSRRVMTGVGGLLNEQALLFESEVAFCR